ncbi:MAG: flagellar biosynthesis anti-sigma factor FlgM [Bdellovibrionales bacterium]|nr:flagellar biosynthesis anti-sigma factor FlgM [Bdellovibrionales bacterium]
MENNQNNSDEKPVRRRSLTSISLGWVADRLRRAEQIKQEISSGSYKIDTAKVAASMVSDED